MESRYCFKVFMKLEFKSYFTTAFSVSLYAAFTKGQREQSIHLLKVELQFSAVLRHTRPVVLQDNIRFQSYIHNKSICIVLLLREYIDRTSSLRGQEMQLFISTQAPFKGVACYYLMMGEKSYG